MGMAKYFEDNTEIIEERRDNYNSSYYGGYSYNNRATYSRKTELPKKQINSYYSVINGKPIAV